MAFICEGRGVSNTGCPAGCGPGCSPGGRTGMSSMLSCWDDEVQSSSSKHVGFCAGEVENLHLS